ncbi:MAG: hypothetical protein WBD47_09445, partial [Phormidesmis sp.]
DQQLSAVPSNKRQSKRQSELLTVTSGSGSPERIRHILLGNANSVRQTIHLLHTLGYSETVLWSPVMAVEEPLVITPAHGEAMSLLIRHPSARLTKRSNRSLN